MCRNEFPELAVWSASQAHHTAHTEPADEKNEFPELAVWSASQAHHMAHHTAHTEPADYVLVGSHEPHFSCCIIDGSPHWIYH